MFDQQGRRINTISQKSLGGNSPNLNGSQLKPFSSKFWPNFKLFQTGFVTELQSFMTRALFLPLCLQFSFLSKGKIGLPSLGHFAQVPKKIIITCSSSNHQIFDLANREDSLAYLSELQGRTNWNKNDIFPQYQSYQNDSQ